MTLTFGIAAKNPAVKITGSQHVDKGEALAVTVTKDNVLTTDTIYATVYHKGTGGNYEVLTEVNSVLIKDSGSDTISWMQPTMTTSGSYKLIVTVKRGDNTILEVPFYFIVS